MELTVPPPLVNDGMKLLMACERGLLRLGVRLPVGVSLLCVARKPIASAEPVRSIAATDVVRTTARRRDLLSTNEALSPA